MSDTSKISVNKYGVSSIIREFVIVVVIAVLLWVSAGFQLWLNAWVYVIFLFLFSAIFMVAMALRNPGVLNLRGAPRKAMRENPMRPYDKIFLAIYTLLFFLIPIFAGLDYQRFFGSWLHLLIAVPFWLVPFGFGLVLVGEAIFGWANVSNPFFHGIMVIQKERGHSVVSKGPYQWVRHPGYLGQLLYYLGTPLLLGSWWAFFLGIILAVAFIYRTSKEDQVLKQELDGYDKYAAQTRKRLFPGIW
ncbi:MAG: methyltransferase family protein [Candidatus Hodarchaeota archaeon]